MALTKVKTGGMTDDAITLAKLAAGTDGNIISYDASGNPVAIATGASGEVLTSAGEGNPPAFAAAGAGGLFASYAILTEEIATNIHSGTFTSGDWRTRHLDDEITDPDSIVAISSDQFTPTSGTYLAQWSAPAYQVQDHQTRLHNATTDTLVEMGTAEFATPTPATTNRSFGMARFTANGSDAYEIQHQCQTTVGSSGFGERTNFGIYYTTQLILFKEA